MGKFSDFMGISTGIEAKKEKVDPSWDNQFSKQAKIDLGLQEYNPEPLNNKNSTGIEEYNSLRKIGQAIEAASIDLDLMTQSPYEPVRELAKMMQNNIKDIVKALLNIPVPLN